jgi:hypothetical protein
LIGTASMTVLEYYLDVCYELHASGQGRFGGWSAEQLFFFFSSFLAGLQVKAETLTDVRVVTSSGIGNGRQ